MKFDVIALGEPTIGPDGDLCFTFTDDRHDSGRLFACVPYRELCPPGEKDDEGKKIQAFLENSLNRWKLPGKFRPYDCLSPDSGYEVEVFDLETGDWRRRFFNLGSRIMHYIEENFFLTGAFDSEAILDFIVSTYFPEVFDHAPRLIIRGASNAGKSKLLEFLAELCYHGFMDADVTGPSLFRLIETEHVTPLLDELQDYSKDKRDDIRIIFKNGARRGGHVTRSIKMSDGDYTVRTYSVYAPMAVVNQSGGVIDDTENNRSITIRMLNAGRRKMPMRPDREELEKLRTELYTLRALWLLHPERMGIGRVFEETISELQDEDGIVNDLTGERVIVNNRARDIAGTLLTVAKFTGTEGAVLEMLRDQQTEIKASESDSGDAKVFRALLRCMMVPEHINDMRIHRTAYSGAAAVTTRQIAEEYNYILAEDGENTGPYQRVSTRTVTNRLVDLGFRIDEKRLPGNMSRLSDRDFAEIFAGNLERFGTEEEQEFFRRNLPETVN